MSPESITDFFNRPEWTYARLFLLEARDQAVVRLAQTPPMEAHTIARLQQEIESLTVIAGDDDNYDSLEDAMKDEIKNLLEQEEQDG